MYYYTCYSVLFSIVQYRLVLSVFINIIHHAMISPLKRSKWLFSACDRFPDHTCPTCAGDPIKWRDIPTVGGQEEYEFGSSDHKARESAEMFGFGLPGHSNDRQPSHQKSACNRIAPCSSESSSIHSKWMILTCRVWVPNENKPKRERCLTWRCAGVFWLNHVTRVVTRLFPPHWPFIIYMWPIVTLIIPNCLQCSQRSDPKKRDKNLQLHWKSPTNPQGPRWSEVGLAATARHDTT